MRLRNIKGAREAIEASPYVILDPENYKGRWHEVFGNDHLLRLEVGMGKGQFIMEQARRHPEVNFIGIVRSYQQHRALGYLCSKILYPHHETRWCFMGIYPSTFPSSCHDNRTGGIYHRYCSIGRHALCTNVL